MKVIITLLLAPALIGCAKEKELLPHEKLWQVGEELVTESDKATGLLREAREAFWPDHPNLQPMLDINKETTACIKSHRLPDEFFTHMHNRHRIEPDSSIINKIAQAYKAETNCYKENNRALQALLDKKG